MFFQGFLEKRGVFLNIAGIIAEFNPLHNGHKYLIQQAKKENDAVVAVMSGNFVQRGDTAIFSKFDRAKAAVQNGVDLCIELPTPWAMATAQTFAEGAVQIMNSLVFVNSLYFGSECADIDLISRTSQIFSDKNFSDLITSQLKNGVTFAAARQTAVSRIDERAANILANPNDILATEYISALNRLNSAIKPLCVKRQGVAHDSNEASGNFLSASKLRSLILTDEIDAIKPFCPKTSFEIIKNANTSNIKRIETDILGKLRRAELSDFRSLPDISEGIENRLFAAAKSATSLNELYSLIKTKRYTLSRIRRLVLSAYLDLRADYLKSPPPYARVLAFSKKGEEIIKIFSSITKIPLVMRAGDFEKLGDTAGKIFIAERNATDLYALSLKTPLPCGTEFTEMIHKEK